MKGRKKNGTGTVDPDFITELEEDKEQAVREFNLTSAKLTAAQLEFNKKKLLVDSLEKFFERIANTNEIAKKVINELKDAQNISDKTSIISKYTVEAVQILAVQARTTTEELERLHKCLKDIQQEAGELANPPDENGLIMKALQTIITHVQEAFDSSLMSLAKIFDAVQYAYQIWRLAGNENKAPTVGTGINLLLQNMLQCIKLDGDGDKIRFPREEKPEDYFDVIKEVFNIEKEKLDGTGDVDPPHEVVEHLLFLLNEANSDKTLAEVRKNALTASLDLAKSANVC